MALSISPRYSYSHDDNQHFMKDALLCSCECPLETMSKPYKLMTKLKRMINLGLVGGYMLIITHLQLRTFYTIYAAKVSLHSSQHCREHLSFGDTIGSDC